MPGPCHSQHRRVASHPKNVGTDQCAPFSTAKAKKGVGWVRAVLGGQYYDRVIFVAVAAYGLLLQAYMVDGVPPSTGQRWAKTSARCPPRPTLVICFPALPTARPARGHVWFTQAPCLAYDPPESNHVAHFVGAFVACIPRYNCLTGWSPCFQRSALDAASSRDRSVPTYWCGKHNVASIDGSATK